MAYRNDTILSCETMKDGTPIEIKHTSDVVNSMVYPFYLRQYAELVDSKLTYHLYGPAIDQFSAIYVTANDVVIGQIVYKVSKENKMSFIALSAVRGDFRGNGLYEIMHKHFESQSKAEGCNYISSWTHKNNIPRQKSAVKVGLEVKYVVLGKYVK